MKNIIEERYFDQIDQYFENIKKSNKRIKNLLSSLEQMGNIILVGGTIRDILIKNEIPRDIDFIIDTKNDIGYILHNSYNCKKNRFGGYKLNINGIEFDIWKITDHWAFKENILETKICNLKKSTFLNFDSLFYNITSKEIIDIDIFNKCISDNILDITLKDEYIYENPSQDINVLRMLIIIDKWKLKLSDRSKDYILRWIRKNESSFNYKLHEAQIRHYRQEVIDKFIIERILNEIELE